MNPEAREYLDTLVKKEIVELTKDHIRFIRARREYLTPEQREKFSPILEEQVKKTAGRPKKVE